MVSDLLKLILVIESYRAYNREFLRGVFKYAKENDPCLFFHEADDTFKSLSDIERIKPDGVIVHLSKKVRKIERMLGTIPCINLGDANIAAGWINVIENSAGIGRMAAEYFLSLGFKEFGFCGKHHLIWSHKRMAGFAAAIENAGYSVNYCSCVDTAKADFSEELPILTKWIKSLPKPVGVMADDDDMAFQIIEVCRMAGINVPEMVAVLGVNDDVARCELANPPLSSVALNTMKAGYDAAEMLVHKIRRSATAADTAAVIAIEPAYVVVRQSTDVLAVPNQKVASALIYIQCNAEKPLQVTDVAEAVSVSRREIERQFNKHLNRSVHQEIKQARVRLISKLLLETTNTVSEIADKMNFRNTAHIGRYFRDVKGINPKEYRRKYGRSMILI